MTNTPRNAAWMGDPWLFKDFLFSKNMWRGSLPHPPQCAPHHPVFHTRQEEAERALSQTHIDPFKVKTSSSLYNHTGWSISGDPSLCLFVELNVRLTAQLSWSDLQLTVWHQIYSAEGCSQYTSVNAMNCVYFTGIRSPVLSKSMNNVIGFRKVPGLHNSL